MTEETSKMGNKPSTAPADTAAEDAARSVARSAERVVLERPRVQGGRRDVHRKHHGCVWAWLKVNENLLPELAKGVFKEGEVYKVWVRFSSSSKRAQDDNLADGRGVAFKLLGVGGERLLKDSSGGDNGQEDTQDFTLINAPAFFAATAATMAVAAELEADDRFPSTFFLPPAHWAGAAALASMATSQADSPLDITYYSQTPYQLGKELLVKYRLRPTRETPPRKEGSKGPNYLFDALKSDLKPRADAPPLADDYQERDGDVKLELQVQRQGESKLLFPEDDATVVWDEHLSQFTSIATLIIPRQVFDTAERMAFAEDISFNPWNGVKAHEPVGSINLARRYAYQASRRARHGINGVKNEPDYSSKTWLEQRKPTKGGAAWTPPSVGVGGGLWTAANALASLSPGLAAWPARFFSSPWGYLAAPLLLAAFLLAGRCTHPAWYCAPIIVGGGPSEAMIPPEVYAPQWKGTAFEQHLARREADPVWAFRYAPVGAEGNGGIPYWIFRILPHLLPQYFGERQDWSEFGLQAPDDTQYYTSYHELPRGVVLTEPVGNFFGTELGFGMHMVTFNCATCHRGEYTDAQGTSHFVDGMPNLAIDTAGYKAAAFHAMRDERFNAANVIREINEALAAEHAKRPKFANGEETPSKLTLFEEFTYKVVVKVARDKAWQKPLAWMATRPPNGPGRLDAFGALRFEFLGFDNDSVHVATVDLPSIWHQQSAWRPWHHWDGNTDQTRARNFGAIIGVGGLPETLRKADILGIGHWIDEERAPYLVPPPYPFAKASDELIKQGQQAYEQTCAGCHGRYDDHGELLAVTDCMRNPDPNSDPKTNPNATDPKRYQAIDAEFTRRLNRLGTDKTLWGPDAFRVTGGYLCPPLDGIWARAPYLHNGSVPTLWHLLGPVDDRPQEFQRGNPAYDTEKAGFVWNKAPEGRRHFTFKTKGPDGKSLDGNSNAGHEFKIDDEARRAIIAYLLTL